MYGLVRAPAAATRYSSIAGLSDEESVILHQELYDLQDKATRLLARCERLSQQLKAIQRKRYELQRWVDTSEGQTSSLFKDIEFTTPLLSMEQIQTMIRGEIGLVELITQETELAEVATQTDPIEVKTTQPTASSSICIEGLDTIEDLTTEDYRTRVLTDSDRYDP